MSSHKAYATLKITISIILNRFCHVALVGRTMALQVTTASNGPVTIYDVVSAVQVHFLQLLKNAII